jgi:hypothetical protein
MKKKNLSINRATRQIVILLFIPKFIYKFFCKHGYFNIDEVKSVDHAANVGGLLQYSCTCIDCNKKFTIDHFVYAEGNFKRRYE